MKNKLSRISVIILCCLISIVVAVAITGCSEDSEDDSTPILSPVDLLVDDDDISGWRSIGSYDEANDFDGLYDLIDGGAEQYIDEGFVSAAFQIYESCVGEVCRLAKVTLRIYDQGESENARAVYEKVSTGIGIPWGGAGTEARIDESGLASYTVEFWEQNFFVQVVIDDKSDDALNIVKLFASQVSSEIE